MHSFRMETKDDQQPVDYEVATGKLDIRYPLLITTRKVPAPGEPAVAKIQRCEVIAYTDKGLLETNKLRTPLRAFDKQGRQLAEVDLGSMSGSDDEGSYRRHRFWGDVAWVEMDEAEAWKDIIIPFSLKPAPPRPKQR
jgi:hypothetical protein